MSDNPNEFTIDMSNISSDDGWMLFMLGVLAMISPEELKRLWDETRKKVEILEEKRRMCPMVEWEQEMGKTIPFCKMDGGFCDYQCLPEKDRPTRTMFGGMIS